MPKDWSGNWSEMLQLECLSWEGEVRTVILCRRETLHCRSVAKEWLDCP
jgi:hypothetical protein